MVTLLCKRNRESGVGSRESGVGSRESGVGSRESGDTEELVFVDSYIIFDNCLDAAR
ncbi:MAG: hypothetical protein F6K26_46430 [Moorea sp. SIO2I5]|nr:hypothetical protein [Moorena sp. SIO2I5]